MILRRSQLLSDNMYYIIHNGKMNSHNEIFKASSGGTISYPEGYILFQAESSITTEGTFYTTKPIKLDRYAQCQIHVSVYGNRESKPHILGFHSNNTTLYTENGSPFTTKMLTIKSPNTSDNAITNTDYIIDLSGITGYHYFGIGVHRTSWVSSYGRIGLSEVKLTKK